MRKHILFLIVLCLQMAARGQTTLDSLDLSWVPKPTQVKSLRYWFDDDAASVQSQPSDGILSLDVSGLTDGLHTLHFQVIDSEDAVAYISSGVFLKMGVHTETSSSVRSLRFWFDDDAASVKTCAVSGNAYTLDVASLTDGLHTLHYQVVDENEQVSYVSSGVFLKMRSHTDTTPVTASKLVYWFDDETTFQTVAMDGDIQQIDASRLSDGLHTVHYLVQCSDGQLTMAASAVFLRMNIDIETTVACSLRYWFDDQQTVTETEVADGMLLLDASMLTDGLHTVHYQIMDNKGTLGAPASAVFLKMNADNTTQGTVAQSLRYWFDDDAKTVRTTSVAGGTQTLDVSDLQAGLHTLNYQLTDSEGRVTPPVTRIFMKNFGKATSDGQHFVTKYKYWLNGNTQDMHTAEVESAANPYTLYALLPVEQQPIRSECFHFEVTDGQPTVYAKNELHVRFFGSQGYIGEGEKEFVDYNVKQEIMDIELLEAGTHATTERPAENAIKWYCVEALHGDSLSFKVDQPCTLQLFSSGGEELYHASGVDALKYGGRYAEVDGTYYLALHDVTANNADNVSIDYLHIDKFALLEVDVDEIGVAPSIVPMTLHGNGFDKLKRISLSLNGNTIFADCKDVIDKATAIAMFTLQGGEQLGAYTLTLEFEDNEDGTVRLSLPDRIHLATPVWGEVAVDVTMARTLATPYPVTIKVENTGNVARLYTPLTIAYNRPDIVRKMNFENFFVSMRNQDYNPVVWTDDFAGTQQRAQSMYLFIPTLAPGETKEVTVSFDAPSHQEFKLFAETGKSANDKDSLPKEKEKDKEKKKDEQDDGNQQETGSGTGQEGKDETGGTDTGGQEETPESQGTGRDCTMVPSLWDYLYEHTDFMPSDDLLDNLEELDLPGVAGRIVERAQQARQVANDARGIGRLLGNVVNGIRLHHYMAVADAAGVDDEMRETLRSSVHLELPSEILNDAGHPFMGAMAALWEWHRMHSECNEEQPTPHTVHILNVGDPNDIVGYMAESGSKYMTEGTTDVYYTIEFENDPEIANAAAHTIVVKDTLDTSRFDLSTFAATGVKIGSVEMKLNGEKRFSKRSMDLRPAIDVIAQVSLSLDEQKGIATWTIESLDPMSMEPAEDAMQGVLPVNYNGNGQGELTFDIKLKPGMVEGESVSNRAGIVFDQEGEIMTPVWTNTVDATQPESSVMEVAMATDTTAYVKIEAYDELSKPWKYDLYVQENADGTWLRKAVNIPVDSMVQMRVEEGVSYGFYVVVTDSAGNVEQKEAAREFTFEVFGSQTDTDTQIELAEGWNWISHNQQEPLSVEALKPASARMVGQVEELIEDTRLGWMGDLEELLPTQMYKVQMDAAQTVQLSGRLFNAGFRSVPLFAGWNWLGYPVAHTMSPAEALQKLEAEEGDMLIGQDGMCTYAEGRWTGTLLEMVPGQGYMYRSAKDQNLFYNATAQASSRKMKSSMFNLQSSIPEDWTVDKRKYPNVMGVIATLWHDNALAQSSDWLLGAFCGDECRGVAQVVGDSESSQAVLMMNVYGMGAETIHFRAVNRETGELMVAAEQEPFKADVLGSMQQPYQLHIGEATGIAEIENGKLTIDNSVYDLQGRKVSRYDNRGVYIVTGEKRAKTQKVVVR